MNVPNILTMFRIVLVAVFAVLSARDMHIEALCVFVLASLTDALDGWIARKFNQITDFGKLMDPLADKLMMMTALICLAVKDMLSPLFAIFYIVKEVIQIFIAAGLYKKKNVVVYSQIFGKLATVLYFAGIGLTFFKETVNPLHIVVLCAAVVCSLCAAAQYIRNFIHNTPE